jgi:cell division protein FtsI/penicillin-binding protein 2
VRPGEKKLLIILFGFLVFVAILTARLFDIQIIKHETYHRTALDQHIAVRSVPGKRGTIYDRNLRPLAMTLPTYTVFVDPMVISKPREVAATLAKVTGISRRSLLARLADRDSRFKIVTRTLGIEPAMELKSMSMTGVYVEPSGRRVRPLGDAGANVTGMMSDDDRPLGGIELTFDGVLRGEPGLRRYLRDARGTARPCIEAVVKQPVDGRSLILTLDADLQEIAEQALDRAVRRNRARGGCLVLVEPNTGDIVALASNPRSPDFAVRTVFEPGSALKICTFAAALELDKTDTSDVFVVEDGRIRVAGGFIRDDHPRKIMTTVDAFKHSSNVVAAMLARRIGQKEFYRYLRIFGFGMKTGVELEGESGGILREPVDWCRRSLETLAIGQEIGITAIQLTMAYACIANRGVLMRPRLVKAIFDDGGEIEKRYPPKVVRRVVTESTAAQMMRLLEAVVEGGTGLAAGIDGICIGGKTGTGQKAECGTYAKGKYYSVFAGVVPLRSPRYTCVVVMDEPDGDWHYGGMICGPVFRDVVESILKREKDLVPAGCLRFADRHWPGTSLDWKLCDGSETR